MQVLLSLLIGYAALYIVIYLHEVGHAIWYCRFGCKKHWYHVTVKPYLFFSTPLPVDIEKADNLSSNKDIIVSYGVVNIHTYPNVKMIPMTKLTQRNKGFLFAIFFISLTRYRLPINI